MKLAAVAIQDAAHAYAWDELLEIFADHFGVPAIRNLPPSPRVYSFSLKEYWLTDYEEPYPMAHVVIDVDRDRYTCDFDGLRVVRSSYSYSYPFTVKFWRT